MTFSFGLRVMLVEPKSARLGASIRCGSSCRGMAEPLSSKAHRNRRCSSTHIAGELGPYRQTLLKPSLSAHSTKRRLVFTMTGSPVSFEEPSKTSVGRLAALTFDENMKAPVAPSVDMRPDGTRGHAESRRASHCDRLTL
jgi:hypothetical protein